MNLRQIQNEFKEELVQGNWLDFEVESNEL